MRYVLGPNFSFTPPVQPAAPSPTGKIDPQIEHLRDDGTVATFAVPPYDPATSNTLCEVRLYLGREGSELPADADGYVASQLPFGHADTAGLQTGGEVPIQLPTVEPVPHHAQYVLGYDA